jgi:hypothetical protein
MNEQDFAERIVRKLDQGLDDLPPGTLYRLRLARGTALSRAHTQELATEEQAGWGLSGGVSARLLNRRVLVPLFGLILGLSAILFWQQSSRQPDYAELDAQVLSDELPVTAYLDTGFEIWLYHQTTD